MSLTRTKSMHTTSHSVIINPRMIIAILFLMVVIFSVPGGEFPQRNTDDTVLVGTRHLPAEDYLLRYSAPVQIHSLAPGVVNGIRGVGFCDDANDLFYFANVNNGSVLSIGVPAGTLYQSTLIGVDADNDGNTEFYIGNDDGTTDAVIEIDLDANVVTRYNLSQLKSIDVIKIGDFDNDTVNDILAVDASTSRLFSTIRRNDSVIIGTYFASSNINYVDVGHVIYSNYDSVVLAKGSTIELIEGDGAFFKSKTLASNIRGLRVFNYDGGIDDIAVTTGSGNLVTMYGSTLDQIYLKQILGSSSLLDIYIEIANVTLDAQQDFAIGSKSADSVYFVDGSDGTIRNSLVDGLSISGPIAVGLIDSDNYSDVVTTTSTSHMCFVHGLNGELGYEEGEIDHPGPQYAFDMNGDQRDDMITYVLRDIYVRLSDTKSPTLRPHPVSPLHPTVLDDYIILEVGVEEYSSIETATMNIRMTDSPVYNQRDMSPSTNGEKYLVFLTGFKAGQYEYYLNFTDSYLNNAMVGSPASPNHFEVTGHLGWETVFDEGSLFENKHVFAEGNSSGGSQILYTAYKQYTSTAYIVINALYPNGTTIDTFNVSIGSAQDADFGIYTGMMDGDNVLDLAIVNCNYTNVGVFVFHGVNRNLWFKSTHNMRISHTIGTMVFDDNQDGADEIHIVDDLTPRLLRMDMSGIWTEQQVSLAGVGGLAGWSIHGWTYAHAALDGTTQIALACNDTYIQLHDATNLSIVRGYNLKVESQFSDVTFKTIHSFYNATHSTDQFMAAFILTNGPSTTTRFVFFDAQTTNISEAPHVDLASYELRDLYLSNVLGDTTDELFLVSTTGALSLNEVDGSFTSHWSVDIGTSDPIGYAILDFDGVDNDELIVLTRQDKKLRSIDINGTLTREVALGVTMRNPIAIGDVDLGRGEDVAVYPIFGDDLSVGALRDLDWFYRMNITTQFDASEILQGAVLNARVTVLNIYDEPIGTATVSLTATYNLGGEINNQTFGLVFDSGMGAFTANIPANWPMGVVNFTVTVLHNYYHWVNDSPAGSVTVKSPLTVGVYTVDTVNQGSNMTIYTTVTDSLGFIVSDATVIVRIDGNQYNASYVSQEYLVIFTGVDFAPGEYLANSTATHPYATEAAFDTASFDVIAQTLRITHNIPGFIELWDDLQGWVNITDPYDNPISGSYVALQNPEYSLELTERAPGCYYLNETINTFIGNYSFDIHVENSYVAGTEFGVIHVAVYGNLSMSVEYDPDVEAGTNFTVSILVQDDYGATITSATVLVEFLGTNHTATPLGGGSYRAVIFANISIGEHNFTVYLSSTYGHPATDWFTLNVRSTAHLFLESSSGWSLTQGSVTTLRITITDWSGSYVPGASVTTLSPIRLAFSDLSNGTYIVDLSLVGYGPGSYEVIVTATHLFLEQNETSHFLDVIGEFDVALSYASPILNSEQSTFNFTILDKYGNPIDAYNYTLFLGGSYSVSGTSTDHYLELSLLPDLAPGRYNLTISLTGDLMVNSTFSWWVDIHGMPFVIVLDPTASDTFVQGKDKIHFAISLTDTFSHPVSNASVKVEINHVVYKCKYLGNGTYARNVSTVGWAYNIYAYTVKISHPLMEGLELYGNVTVLAQPVITITPSSKTPTQFSNLTIEVEVKDLYGTPITGLTFTVTFATQVKQATETAVPGVYVAVFENITYSHGTYPISVDVKGAICTNKTESITVYVAVPVPELSLTQTQFMYGIALSLLISLVGMMLYFKVASIVTTSSRTPMSVSRSVKRLDITYVAILGVGAIIMLHSRLTGAAGQYGMALAESILLIGIAVLLYGLWLYRDAYSAILQLHKLSKRRMALGIWHLMLVPFLIIQIIEFGQHIELFQVYILENTIHLGSLAIPTILVTVFGTYMSSIVIVVVNLYREIRKGLGRIEHMEQSGTPVDVVVEERSLLVERTGASIRTKFLMFLIIVGATTASSLDFIRSYSLAVIILMPIVFLVIIPYLSSKIVKGIPLIIARFRGRSSATKRVSQQDGFDEPTDAPVDLSEAPSGLETDTRRTLSEDISPSSGSSQEQSDGSSTSSSRSEDIETAMEPEEEHTSDDISSSNDNLGTDEDI